MKIDREVVFDCSQALPADCLRTGRKYSFTCFFKTVMEERKDIKGPSVTGFYVRIYLYLAGKMQINSSQ